MKKRFWLAASCSLFLSLAVSCASGSIRLEARVVDDATGTPVAARVAILDSNGKGVEIEGKHERLQQFGKTWSYVDGAFVASIPDSGASIEIRRGIETRPVSETISRQFTDKIVQRTFRLRRWVDMRAQGYVGGDLHAHGPAPADAALQMRAEDLNAMNLLQPYGNTDGAITGKPDETSTPGYELWLGQETADWHMGHLTFAGLKKSIPGYSIAGGSLDQIQSNPHIDLLSSARAARQQGALVSIAHFENLPGGSPVAVAVGLLEAIEMPTWSDPMQLPAHLDPWEKSGMPTAELAPMRGADLYYQLLNAGFRLPLAAGTDKFGQDIPVGGNRVYVLTKGGQDFAAWLAGIRAGKGFVTNGPILQLEVDGHLPGDVVEFQGAKSVKARVIARSILPFTTLEILLNGRTVGHKMVVIQNNPPVDGVYSMRLEATVQLDKSGWLAARAFSDPDRTPRLVARECSLFSHTSPVYFLQDGRNVREEASVVYLRKYVKGFMNWLGTKPAFDNEKNRAAVQRDVEEALRYYEGL